MHKTQNTKHKTQENTQQTSWAAAALPSSGFAIYCHGNIRHGLNSRRWGSLRVHRRLPATGSHSPQLVPSFRVPTQHTPSKNRAIGMALVLGGHRFMIRHHNQPDSWQSARGGARGEMYGGGVCGVTMSHRLDHRINQQKNTKNIIQVGLRWLLIGNFIRNKQPKPITCRNWKGGNG